MGDNLARKLYETLIANTRSWEQLCAWVRESMRVPSRLECERDALHDALRKLVSFVDKHGGYMSAQHQASLRGAKALLVEVEERQKETR